MNALATPLNLALFDLDNTLLAGDSDFEWAQFLIAKGVLDAELHAAMNDTFFSNTKKEHWIFTNSWTFSSHRSHATAVRNWMPGMPNS